MNFEFMTIDTPLPPCMPLPRALTGFPVSSTAKVMYCRMLDAMLSKGQEDENGILFVCFPVTAIAAVLSRSSMTVKRSLNELETAGLIMRVRQGVGEPNRIYVLIPGKERVPMKGATSIQERLWELRKDKGLNLEELSELTGISKSALGSYEKEDYKEINHGNLITLADFYGVSVDYLLCRTENREQINTPLTELHLNDEMVALLKSGRINNRLLCELATHKDFIKFLADIEIYVDGIATMQIQNLNALVDTVRHEIIERYRPGEDDPHLKVLQAAHISDDEYFSHMVRDDLNLIIRDIREAHKKDSESAPQTTVANELKENLEAVENFKGSRDEKLVVLYCKQLGINYKNLSDEEFRWLIRILKKSKKMGTPISQRKKR
jgi:transcriptional regulator with XRE-family HTH domain